jgi:hypothetical protein
MESSLTAAGTSRRFPMSEINNTKKAELHRHISMSSSLCEVGANEMRRPHAEGDRTQPRR